MDGRALADIAAGAVGVLVGYLLGRRGRRRLRIRLELDDDDVTPRG